ncbi:hypothetical protein [Streptomyces litmocidini]|uniref:hypothetical protein n=1 Tax=Streptomyces litmocidini TaxID=67318 RepID=UPI001E534CDE|nr:hypothetical protein [Streptomyces litmocidini]
MSKTEIDRVTTAFHGAFDDRDGKAADGDRIRRLVLPQGVIVRTAPPFTAYSVEESIAPRERLLSDGRLVEFSEGETSEETRIERPRLPVRRPPQVRGLRRRALRGRGRHDAPVRPDAGRPADRGPLLVRPLLTGRRRPVGPAYGEGRRAAAVGPPLRGDGERREPYGVPDGRPSSPERPRPGRSAECG